VFKNPGDQVIKELLTKSRTVAVVGLSNKPERDSYQVAEYLQKHGYRVIPVNPVLSEVLGEKAYPDLASIPEPVDIVNVFRRSEEVPAVVSAALPVKPAAIWLQLGVVNGEAAAVVGKQGVAVIMDRCIKIEHNRLLGECSPFTK